MFKISLTIIIIYILYYAGNIIYDVFLKKENKDKTEELEEFSLSEISNEKEVSNISIEDVENLNTPKSFNKYPIQKDNNENSNERQSLDELRQLFEAEQDLDDVDFFQENSHNSDKQSLSKETEFSDEKSQKEEHCSQDTINKNIKNISQSKDWKTLLNLSETLVQLVANHDGHKVYHSVM